MEQDREQLKTLLAEVLRESNAPPSTPRVLEANTLGKLESSLSALIDSTKENQKTNTETLKTINEKVAGVEKQVEGVILRVGALETTETVRDKSRDMILKVIGIILTICLFTGGILWSIVQYLLPKR